MKRLIPLMLLSLILALSCGTSPEADVESIQEPVPVPVPVPAEPAPVPQARSFDPANVSKDIYDATKAEVEQLVEKLNVIIAARDYDAWLSYLSDEYFEEISSPAFLKQVSDSDFMKIQRKVIRTPRDYFINVVVPSRSNNRVDDISFITEYNVRVIQINQRRRRPPADSNELARVQAEGAEVRDGWLYENSREIYYELEKTQDEWKIVT
ncbi:MAG: hypothetical protein LBJ90_02220 [Treponema sp.]|jgi:hypothetical protein|nr:hypothetical protein [Treponema sp.]